MSRFSAWDAWVSSESAGEDIQVQGREAVNRALDGDIVAVRLLTPAEAAEAAKAAARCRTRGKAQPSGGNEVAEGSGDEEDEEPQEDGRIAEVRKSISMKIICSIAEVKIKIFMKSGLSSFPLLM